MPVANNSPPHGIPQHHHHHQHQQQHGNPILLINKPVSAVVGASWLYPFKVTLLYLSPSLSLSLIWPQFLHIHIYTKTQNKQKRLTLSLSPSPPFSKKLGYLLLSHPPFPLPPPPNTPDPRLFTFHLRPLQLIHLDLSPPSRLPRHLPRSARMGSGCFPRAGRGSRDRGAVV